MKVSSAQFELQYTTRVQKLAMNVARVEGEAAVKLIEEAKAAPVGPEGQGRHVNTYA